MTNLQLPDTTANGRARAAALDTGRPPDIAHTATVEFLANGRVLIVGEESGALYAAQQLDDGLVADARIALGAVAPVPLLAAAAGRVLIGDPPDEDHFRRAAKTAAKEAQPITDLRGTEEFRRDLVEVLAFRLLRVDGETETPIEQTRLLSQASDPNQLLSAHEFALFPI